MLGNPSLVLGKGYVALYELLPVPIPENFMMSIGSLMAAIFYRGCRRMLLMWMAIGHFY